MTAENGDNDDEKAIVREGGHGYFAYLSNYGKSIRQQPPLCRFSGPFEQLILGIDLWDAADGFRLYSGRGPLILDGDLYVEMNPIQEYMGLFSAASRSRPKIGKNYTTVQEYIEESDIRHRFTLTCDSTKHMVVLMEGRGIDNWSLRSAHDDGDYHHEDEYGIPEGALKFTYLWPYTLPNVTKLLEPAPKHPGEDRRVKLQPYFLFKKRNMNESDLDDDDEGDDLPEAEKWWSVAGGYPAYIGFKLLGVNRYRHSTEVLTYLHAYLMGHRGQWTITGDR